MSAGRRSCGKVRFCVWLRLDGGVIWERVSRNEDWPSKTGILDGVAKYAEKEPDAATKCAFGALNA